MATDKEMLRVAKSDQDLEKARPTSPSLKAQERSWPSLEAEKEPQGSDAEINKGVLHTSGEDGYIVDWDGPDDPQNPMNWTDTRKWTIIALVSALTFNVFVPPFSIDTGTNE